MQTRRACKPHTTRALSFHHVVSVLQVTYTYSVIHPLAAQTRVGPIVQSPRAAQYSRMRRASG